MRIRIGMWLVLLGVLFPGQTFAAQGILLLVDDGQPEWTTHLTELVGAVDKRKPTDMALWSASDANVQAAVDRLVRRGVSGIVAVPLFIAAVPPDLGSRVKSPVPLQVTTPLNGDPVVADILLGRAQEISRNAAAEVLVLVSYRSTASVDKRWFPDLAAAAQQLNRTRSFAVILTATLTPDASAAETANALRHMIQMVERQIALGRRILVVPVLTSHGATDPVIEEHLQGLAHDVAKNGLMPDDRLVAWIVSKAAEK